MQSATATQFQARIPRYLAPAALASALAGVVLVAAISVGTARTQSSHASSVHRIVRRGPGYWTVHRGDTYARISAKTGLSIDQLEALNPDTDPYSLAPGQRQNCRCIRRPHAPNPHHHDLGPCDKANHSARSQPRPESTSRSSNNSTRG